VELNAVWRDAALMVEVIKETHPCHAYQRLRVTLRRVEIVHQLLSKLRVELRAA
jgi:hypothetical protein